MTTKGDIISSAWDWAEETFGNPKLFTPGKTPVPVSGATIYPEDVVSILETALSGWYTEFKTCGHFSRALGKTIGKPELTLCNSGSSANLLAVTGAIEYMSKPGRYVITCATGFPTTVSSIYQNNRIPYYVDIDPETLSPNLDQIECARIQFGSRISGVIVAHTLGFPFDEWAVRGLLYPDEHWFVADCCDALGAEIIEDGRPLSVGTFADASTFSFYPAHHITTGEGGAVATSIHYLHSVIESLNNWGRDCYCAPGNDNTCGARFDHHFPNLPVGWDHKYTFARLGYNLKMTELQAALGLSQLSRLSQNVHKRQQNYYYLRLNLDRYQEYLHFIKIPDWSTPSPFGFPILVRKEAPFGAGELISHLEKNLVRTRRVFGGNLTRQPAFSHLEYASSGSLTGSDAIMERGFWIGCQDALDERHLEYVLEVFESFFEGMGL